MRTDLFKILKTRYWSLLALLAQYQYGNPSRKLKVIGVTGTNGKTTTATLLYRIATELGYKASLIGTVENIIGTERREATHTTADSVTLTKLLAEMVERGCEYVFMEASSHALDQKRVSQIHFAGAIFTNLTHDHLDYHKNLENYFSAKKKLFDALDYRAFALGNADDTHGRVMLGQTKAVKFFYGFEGEHEDVEFHGDIEQLNFSGLELKFNHREVRSKLLGKFNAYNLLAVWSASSLLGFDMKKVNIILEDIEPPLGRFQHFGAPNGALIIVDYAHTPDALEKVLLTVCQIKPKENKLISVFGCGGDRDPLKRPIMGRIGAELSDIAIFTSDNPRSENPDKIIEEMKAGLSDELTHKIKTVSDRRLAIKQALSFAKKGDIILCAGKGHETYQDIEGVKTHFDDVEEFKKLF